MEDVDDIPVEGIKVSSVQDADGTLVMSVIGDLDLMSADSLRNAVAKALQGPKRPLVFELSGLHFIDSAGLAVLIEAASSAESVELRAPSPAVRRAVELTGLSDVLTVVP
jgi:anti-sigma B factor antagonist